MARELNAYEGSIAYLDHQLGMLFRELGARGILDSTLVVVSSDHGEQFGEHGYVGHANSLYGILVHVPLVISFPGRIPSGIVKSVVSLRDLPATVMDQLNLGSVSPFEGRSLAAWWSGEESLGIREDTALSEVEYRPGLPGWPMRGRGAIASVVMDHWHYIRSGDGREELYDLGVDPEELEDRARESGLENLLERLRAAAGALGSYQQEMEAPSPP